MTRSVRASQAKQRVESPTRSRKLHGLIVRDVAERAPFEPRLWLGIMIERLLETGKADCDALDETLGSYRGEAMTLPLFYHLSLRLSGNIARLRGGLPVSRRAGSGELGVITTARVVRRYAADDAGRPDQVDFLPGVGPFAGDVLPGRTNIKPARLIRVLDPRNDVFTRVDDLLGCEFQVYAELKDGRVDVSRVLVIKPQYRTRMRELQRYRYRRGPMRLATCRFSSACVLCPRGQLPSGTMWPCECAVKPVSEEVVSNETSSGGAVSVVPVAVAASQAAG